MPWWVLIALFGLGVWALVVNLGAPSDEVGC